jgi:hypothetical protein
MGRYNFLLVFHLLEAFQQGSILLVKLTVVLCAISNLGLIQGISFTLHRRRHVLISHHGISIKVRLTDKIVAIFCEVMCTPKLFIAGLWTRLSLSS